MTPPSLSSVSVRRHDAHGQRLQAVYEVRAQAHRRPGELEANLPRQDLLEQDPDLEAREERAEAEVRSASPERGVRVRSAPDVEPLRVIEHLLVEICRQEPHGNPIAGLNR